MIKNKILNTIKKNYLINKGDNIIIGVSGGPDSMCLLDILNSLKDELKINIYVCHVNHCLRENAILDEEYVINYCKKNNIEYFVKRVDIKNKSKFEKTSEEEAGRHARYEFFEDTLIKTQSTKIAVAHNACDNVETIIMNLLRGSRYIWFKGNRSKKK